MLSAQPGTVHLEIEFIEHGVRFACVENGELVSEIETGSRLPAAGRHIIAALRDCGPRPEDDSVMLGLSRALITLAVEHLNSDAAEPETGSEARWRRMSIYMQEHCHESLSRAQVARVFHVNPATCSVLTSAIFRSAIY